MERIRIIIVDDNRSVLESLRLYLGSEPDIEVLGLAADGTAGLELAERMRPDVLVMDNSMPGMSGLEATRALAAAHPDIAVIMYTGDTVPRPTALAAGARAFVTKDEPLTRLLGAIRSMPRHAATRAHDLA